MSKKSLEQLYKELRLSDRLKKQAAWFEITDTEAREALGHPTGASLKKKLDFSGIAIPGWDLRGADYRVYQVRRHNPEINERGKAENKYVSAVREFRTRWINTTPGALKPQDHVFVVEGPKALWAVTAYFERVKVANVKVIDLNGLPGWRVKESDDGPSHPNADLLLLAGHRVTTLFDSNSFRDDLKPLVADLNAFLTEIGCQVDVGRVPALEGVNGPDDLIARKDGDKAFKAVLDAAQPLWYYECPAVSDFDPTTIKSDLLIEHLVANKSLALFASPSENYKTMIAMCLSKSLLDKKNAFECDHFRVNKTVPGVLYMCPDMSHEMTILYASKFSLHREPFVGRFRIRTMKQGEILGPDHPTLIQAAKAGWFIVLDTMNYFTLADDDNNPQQLNKFIQKVRRLVDSHGASGVLMLVHPTKVGTMSNEVEVTQWVSGTYGKIGSVDTIFCMKKIKDESGEPVSVWVSREKSRPFLGVTLPPFTLALVDGQGSTIDKGRLPVSKLNAGALKDHLPKQSKGGAQGHPQKEAMMKFIRQVLADNKGKKPLGRMEVLAKLNKCKEFNPKGDQGNCGVTDRTVGNWLKELREDKTNVQEIVNEEA